MKTTTQKKTKTLRQMDPQERFHETKIALLMKVRRVKRATAEAIIQAQDEERLEQKKNEEDEASSLMTKPPRRSLNALKASRRASHGIVRAEDFFGIE